MFKCSYYLTLNDFELLGVHIGEHFNNENIHFVKNVQIWSFSGPHFPVFSQNTGKYWPEKSPHLHTFHAVITAFFLGSFTTAGLSYIVFS